MRILRGREDSLATFRILGANCEGLAKPMGEHRRVLSSVEVGKTLFFLNT